MSKKLTKDHFEYMKAQGPNFATYHDWNLLMDHIEDVGVFAAEEPTDEEINATIAKAQGWKKIPPSEPGDYACWIFGARGKLIRATDYSPVSNLGQAVDAAKKLVAYAPLDICDGRMFVKVGAQAQKWVEVDTAADAARVLARHLYDRVKEQDGDT